MTVMVGTVMVGSQAYCLCNIHCCNSQVYILYDAVHQQAYSTVPDILCLISSVSQEHVGSHSVLLAL